MTLLMVITCCLQTADASNTELKYSDIAKNYSRKKPPKGFVEFSAKNGIPEPNTCAVRLSYALFKIRKEFFKDVSAKSGVEWHGLPTRADDLAIILNKKVKKAIRVSNSSVLGKHGIIFFDKIKGFDGTGHISLWNGTAVVDGGDYFKAADRVYFWELK